MEKEVGIYLDHSDAKMPTLAYEGDVGYDLYAIEDTIIPFGALVEVNTGVHLQLPSDVFAQINTRSSFGKKGLCLHHGVIDSGFTGQLSIWIFNIGKTLSFNYDEDQSVYKGHDIYINKGDKIAQILFHKAERPLLKQIKRLKKTERGDKGHGSSGK